MRFAPNAFSAATREAAAVTVPRPAAGGDLVFVGDGVGFRGACGAGVDDDVGVSGAGFFEDAGDLLLHLVEGEFVAVGEERHARGVHGDAGRRHAPELGLGHRIGARDQQPEAGALAVDAAIGGSHGLGIYALFWSRCNSRTGSRLGISFR